MDTQGLQHNAPETLMTEQVRSKKMVPLIAGAVVLVILAAIGVYYVAFRPLPTAVSWAPSVAATPAVTADAHASTSAESTSSADVPKTLPIQFSRAKTPSQTPASGATSTGIPETMAMPASICIHGEVQAALSSISSGVSGRHTPELTISCRKPRTRVPSALLMRRPNCFQGDVL